MILSKFNILTLILSSIQHTSHVPLNHGLIGEWRNRIAPLKIMTTETIFFKATMSDFTKYTWKAQI